MNLDLLPPDPGAERYVYDDVQLLRVVDGDTLRLRFPLPFNALVDLDVRLLGINAPEKVGASRAEGEAAKAHMQALLRGCDGLRARSHRTDRYGRYLAEVWARYGPLWVNLSAAMLAAGHAVEYDGGARS